MSLVLALWLAATPFELPDTDQPWAHIVTPHFDIISSSGDRRTRELARDLETLAAALADIRPASATHAPVTRVFLFARRRDVQPFFDLLMKREKADVNGAFVAEKDHAWMFIDDTHARMSDRTPYHELVHYLMGNSPRRAPLWIEEGLAEYYSSAEVHGGIIRVGVPIREHIELLKHHRLPVSELFATTDSIAQTFYAESWAIVDWMINRDRRAFDAFLRDVLNGTPSDVALQKYFHKTPAELDRIIESGGATWLPATMTLQVRVPEITSDATRIDRADLLYELGHFLAAFDDAQDVSQRYLRAAVASNPKHARAFAALGDYDAAIAADPKDGEVALEYAEYLLRDPEDEARFRHARKLAQKALDLGADRARALGALGTSYQVENDPTPGIEPLETALALAPSRLDFELHLRTIRVHTELAQINTLVKAGNLDDAAKRTRALLASTPDIAAKAQLEQQAKQLEADAASNREINAYNDAVERFNTGDYKGAKKIVDELLKSAHDAQVIEDASRMRGLLAQIMKKR